MGIFNVSIARTLQEYLSRFVRIEPLPLESVDTVVGVDVGYRGSTGIGVAVAYSVRRCREVCHTAVEGEVSVPYIPGLLAFREVPLMVAALKELRSRCTNFDVVMVNGHGIAHPRKFGIASHIGVVLSVPSIGVAKKILYGDVEIVDGKEVLMVNGTRAGYVVESPAGGKVYISVGHRITPDDALAIAKSVWSREHLLPTPLHIADSLAKKYRKYIKV